MSIFIHGGESSLFYLFSTLCILSGIMVIRSKNPVHSVLFLILVFCNASGLLILLGLDFFAMVFLVVYVGAIAVLFLFVVMMLNIKLVEINETDKIFENPQHNYTNELLRAIPQPNPIGREERKKDRIAFQKL